MSTTLLRTLGWALADASLLVLILALGAVALLQATSRRRSSLRYGIAFGALQLALLVPIAGICWTLAGTGRAAEAGDAPGASPAPIETEQYTWGNRWLGTAYRTLPIPPNATERLIAGADPLVPWAGAVWLVGVALVVAWHLGGWFQLRRVLKRSRRPGSAFDDCLDRLSARLGLRRSVHLRESEEAAVPLVAGLRQPTIVAPSHVLDSMDRPALEALLVHELAHVRRHDGLANLAQIATETILFFHPGVWWLSRAARQERECCCDDLAVRVLEDELLYARSLLRLQEARLLCPQASLHATGGALAMRIERLCGEPDVRPSSALWRGLSALLAATLAVAVLVGHSRWLGPLGLTAVAGAYGSAVRVDAGLVAHYPFDGDAREVSGLGRDGVVKGATPTTDRFGRATAAYDFDGRTSRIEAAAALQGAGSISASCWVLPRSHGQWESWAAKSGFDGKRSQWRVGLGAAPDEWGLTQFTSLKGTKAWQDYWVRQSPVPLGVWSHVVAVLDVPRHEVTLYRNGVRLATFPSVEPPTASEGRLYVGYQSDDGVYFDGKIDDLRVYARTLTPAEVRALYRDRP